MLSLYSLVVMFHDKVIEVLLLLLVTEPQLLLKDGVHGLE